MSILRLSIFWIVVEGNTVFQQKTCKKQQRKGNPDFYKTVYTKKTVEDYFILQL